MNAKKIKNDKDSRAQSKKKRSQKKKKNNALKEKLNKYLFISFLGTLSFQSPREHIYTVFSISIFASQKL